MRDCCGARLSQRLLQEPSSFWPLLVRTSHALGTLHVLGITHMDASLSNTLDAVDGCRLIDFEYEPRVGITFEQQMAYDHLRLLESSLKVMPVGEHAGLDAWLEVLNVILPKRVRGMDIAPLAPAISRVLACRGLRQRLTAMFPSIDQHP